MLDHDQREHRVKQLAKMFAGVIAGVERGQYTNAVLVPFNQGDQVEVHITQPSGEHLIRKISIEEVNGS